MKQKQKQDQLDDDQNQIQRQQKKKNEIDLKDDACIDTSVPRSIITMNAAGIKYNSDSVVRFDMNFNERYEIESHMDFSKKERKNYWWNDREKDKTMDKLERLIAKYEQRRKQTKKSTQFFRGIESWTTTGSLKLDHDIEQCRRAVMDEQNKQWNSMKTIEYDKDYYDSDPIERIANCSRKVTYDNTQRAHLNGLEDAQEAWQLTGESWMQQNFISDDINSVGSKKGSRRLLSRHDSFMNGSKSMSKNNKEDDTSTLYSLKSNASMTSLRKKWVPKKNKQMTTTTTTTTIANNEEENDGVMTMTQSKMVKETKRSKSSNANKKLSSDPPGSRLIIQEDENEMV